MSWANILKQYEQEFKEAEVNSYTELPDGKYTVKVETARLKESKNHGIPMLAWEFVVVDGEYEGRHEWKYSLIMPERMQWLKQDLFSAGLELEELHRLEEELPSLLDRLLEIKIETKMSKNGKEYRNVYIQKVVDRTPSQKPENPFSPNNPFADDGKPINISDDDLPF